MTRTTSPAPLLFALLAAPVLCACSETGNAAPPPGAKATTLAPAPKSAEPVAVQVAATIKPAELTQPAPEIALKDLEGKRYDLAALKGKTVVLEWFNPECPFVRAAHAQGLLKDMAKHTQSGDIVWLSINSAAPGKQGYGADRNREGQREYAIENPILLDETGRVGHSYGAIKTPHLFIVDPTGKLVYRGGIDNAPMNVVDDARPRPPSSKPGERVNYVDSALQDLKAGRPVALPDTPPYGCTVKYAS
jgi:peroxiredoxin